MTTQLPSGAGGATGDRLAVESNLSLSGTPWYVHASTGADSAGYGLSKAKPFASLAYAISQASARDIIFLMGGHAETLTATITVSKALVIAGMEKTAGIPTAVLTNNAAAAETVDITAAGVELRNIKFAQHSQTNALPAVLISASDTRIKDCYFECGEFNTSGAQVGSSLNTISFEGCTFISVGTAANSVSTYGLYLPSAVTGLVVRDCIFDGSTYGFDTMAFDARAAAVTDIRGEGISLLRGADFGVHASSTGFIGAPTGSGEGRVVW